VSSSKEVIDWLRQKSRPYLFSNTLAPAITATSLAVLAMLKDGDGLRRQLRANALQFRTGMTALGFTLLPGEHPIIPVMFYDAPLAQAFAAQLLQEGVYVTGFFFPVVPKGQARIRTQMSAAHTREDILAAIAAFAKVGRALGVIK
jgi:glycine C-acetyltransferase